MTAILSREPRVSLGLTMERRFSSAEQNAGQGRRARYGRRISQIVGDSLSHRSYPGAVERVPRTQCDGQKQQHGRLLGAQWSRGQVHRRANANKQDNQQRADCRSDVKFRDHCANYTPARRRQYAINTADSHDFKRFIRSSGTSEGPARRRFLPTAAGPAGVPFGRPLTHPAKSWRARRRSERSGAAV